MVRKIVTFLVLVSMSFWLLSPYTFANDIDNYLYDNISNAGNDLLKVSNGAAYKKQIDAFFEAKWSDSTVMYTLDERLWAAEDIVYYEGADERTTAIVLYLRAKLNVALEDIYTEEEENREQEAEKIAKEMFTSTISDRDSRKVEKAILSLQDNMLEHWNNFIEDMLWDIEAAAKTKETGDLEMDFSFDQEIFWKASGELTISNYVGISDIFDVQLLGDIAAAIDLEIQNQERVSVNYQSSLDYIKKDSQEYILMDNITLDIETEDEAVLANIEAAITQAEALAKENTYIRMVQQNAVPFISQLETVNLIDIFGEIEIATEIPFLEAYKKEGDRYYLKPTKHLCDTVKSTMNRFDPFYGDECSDGQYYEMLASLATFWGDIYITLGSTTNTLWFEVINPFGDIYEASIIYDNSNVREIHVDILPDQETYPGEGLNLEYERKSHITLSAIANSVEIKAHGALNSKNKLYETDASFKMNGETIGHISLVDGEINGGIDYTMTSYDWFSGESYESYKISSDIWGKWDGESLTKMELTIDYDDLRQEGSYGSFELQYGMDKANSLAGNANAFLNNEEIMSMDLEGVLESDYIDIKSNIIIKDANIPFLFPGESEMLIHFDIMWDARNSKNNAEIHIDAMVGEQTPFEFNLKNTGKVETFKGEIEAPEKYVEIEDLIQEILPIEEIYY